MCQRRDICLAMILFVTAPYTAGNFELRMLIVMSNVGEGFPCCSAGALLNVLPPLPLHPVPFLFYKTNICIQVALILES